MPIRGCCAWLLCYLVTAGALLHAQAPDSVSPGSIRGTVVADNAQGLSGVLVTVRPGDRSTFTNRDGVFTFDNLSPGRYSLSFSLGGFEATRSDVQVRAGEATVADLDFEGDFNFTETITVEAASRRQERLVDAPAAMTTLSESDITLSGGAGQIPNLLSTTVGAEPTQSGLYDFDFNVRGFNGFLTRRVQVLVDGRDPSIPATYSQEWWTVSFLTDDVDSIELLRGPSAALYGPNSVNGVLSLRTKSPRDSPGGTIRVTGGELGTFKADVRWAGDLGNGWFAKLLGNHTRSSSFARSRNQTVEYAGLPGEPAPLRPGKISFSSGSLRLDKYFASGHVLTMEGGLSTGENVVFVAQAGRVQELDVRRWWGRFNVNAPNWNAAVYYDGRTGDQIAMQANVPLFNDDYVLSAELQGHREFANGRGRWVGGVSYARSRIDSADRRGLQTLYSKPIRTDEQAIFSQIDLDVSEDVKLVFAGRIDDSSLHDTEFSPKFSVVYRPSPRHTLRLGYNRAFQVGNYTELFLSVPGGPPIDLSALEDALAPALGGVPLGLGVVPISALGNPDLGTEKIASVEAGYLGILGSRTTVTVDWYHNRMRDFISDLLPGINPAYPPYQAPSSLPPESAALVEATVNAAVPGLTNDRSGAPWLVLSNANTGRVTSRGLEVAVNHQPDARWLLNLTYAWFDFTVRDETPGVKVTPNAPGHRMSFGATYRASPLAATARYRWVQGFDWASGVFIGRVESFGVVDVDASYDLTRQLRLGANVSNLLNDKHHETFGGDVLGRRALSYLSVSW